MVVSSSESPELSIPTKNARSLSKQCSLKQPKSNKETKNKSKSMFLGYKSGLYRN